MADHDEPDEPSTGATDSPSKRRLIDTSTNTDVPECKRLRFHAPDEEDANSLSIGHGSTSLTNNDIDVTVDEEPAPVQQQPMAIRRNPIPFKKWDDAMKNQRVDRKQFRRVGPYILGPKIGASPVESISQYLAKREGSDKFVFLKVNKMTRALLLRVSV